MRVLLADDEPIALDRLELALAGIPAASLAARARNGREALRLMQELRPEIAVLDIRMPGMDGLQVVEMLGAGDHARPLAEVGRKAAALVGAELKKLGEKPELVLVSSALRTRQTFEELQAVAGLGAPQIEDDLYLAASGVANSGS